MCVNLSVAPNDALSRLGLFADNVLDLTKGRSR